MEIPPHTYRHLDEELKALHDQILEMGGLVEKQIADALTALVERDSELARQTIVQDHAVNRMDVEIDDFCIRLFARYQPTARDLRLITTGLKITTDLERMGDLAESIAKCACELNEEPPLMPFIDIPRMAGLAQRMVREALDAFVREDTALALRVCESDAEIDALHDQLFRILLTYMVENPQTVTRVVRLSLVAKSLERIADHATNIAEMVVFMVKGQSIRHLAPVPDS
ncbi:MAG TPA: phosphate signaling complex protein PhoU [Candidatus Acidoferrales bacterium]|nr:phosphate signaling complex protein PhoU [Candidatus Acidoferrales bacterium]